MTGKKKVLISFEGQQHSVDEDIANNDNELRKLLTTYYPDCANADIIRKPGELITIAKRNGSKGAIKL
ncbi:hypothetical protein [Floridanema aerugineum]|uniref:Uncharacterized protein n=1 Tax=Floridaenema aerugineum BLCC-F46 TaxID=3153654 RepID=A0ABV4XCV8_9CYAN